MKHISTGFLTAEMPALFTQLSMHPVWQVIARRCDRLTTRVTRQAPAKDAEASAELGLCQSQDLFGMSLNKQNRELIIFMGSWF